MSSPRTVPSTDAPSCPLEPSRPGSAASIETSGLRFSSDCYPGIAREEAGGRSVYRLPGGQLVDDATRERIERLAIPPAWTSVWICPDELGYLQATGRDARGRKQYLYHELWRSVRDATKYARLLDFGEALEQIRRSVDRDLRSPELSKRRVTALLVAVLDNSFARVGNPEYVRQNESFGLTTLRSEHAEVRTARVRLTFRGKAGKEFDASIDDARIARTMRRLTELPGKELFRYVGADGRSHPIGSGDVNDYLRSVSGMPVTSKDFRTWGGTLTAARALVGLPPERGDRAVTIAIKEAAAVLGNTPAVCRKSYVHPGIIGLYLSGRLQAVWREAGATESQRPHLSDDERRLLGVLHGLADQ